MDSEIRLAKLMAQRGMCSRREAEAFIERGLVLVDGQIINVQGTKVSTSAKIELLKKARDIKNEKVTILLNKPVGIVSNLPEKGYRPAIDLIIPENQSEDHFIKPLYFSHKKKLSVAGRLDIDSKGLLVFTQDGTIAKLLIGENSNIEKEYIVGFKGKINDQVLSKLSFGLSLDGKLLKKAYVEQLSLNSLKIILKEGKKRQIRRMCEEVNLKVVSLIRVRIGNVSLGDLPPGKWRFLKKEESF